MHETERIAQVAFARRVCADDHRQRAKLQSGIAKVLKALPTKLVHEIQVGVGDPRSGPRVLTESLYKDRSIIFDSHPDDDPPEQEGPPYLFVRLPRDSRNRKHGKRLRFLDNQPVLSQFPGQGEASKAYREAALSYAAALASRRFLDLSPEAMKIPSFPGQVVLGDRGENLSSVLQAICQEENMRRTVAEWVRELTPLDVVDFEFVPEQTGRVLVSLVESNGQRTSAYSASDGTLRFLAMIAALLGPDVAQFYFLEEIDNGIHPTRLYLLLQLIEQQAKDKKVQIVTTTHSPQLLGMLSPAAREHASLAYRLDGEQESASSARARYSRSAARARRAKPGPASRVGLARGCRGIRGIAGGDGVNVLIILEDFRKDQYVVGPIVRRMLAEVGKPNANVRVCRDPLMGGVSEALKWERIKEVLHRYASAGYKTSRAKGAKRWASKPLKNTAVCNRAARKTCWHLSDASRTGSRNK